MFGTGVLINHNLVLTNYHVIKGLLDRPDRYTSALCRFDFTEDPDEGRRNPGRAVGFAQDWDVAWSRYSPKDEIGAETGFERDLLDYAIIRLKESVGSQPLSVGADRYTEPPVRGWLMLPPDPALPRAEEMIWIWQHPVDRESYATGLKSSPLKWTSGRVQKLLDVDLRMRHTATTFKGSSGAPCYDGNFNFVALHHGGDPNATNNYIGMWNQAIPTRVIVEHLKKTERGHLVGVAPPPRQSVLRRTEPAARAVQIAADIADKRIEAAKILMDRDGLEELILWSRDKATANPGIVHVLVSRYVDRHSNFIQRLLQLSLPAQGENLDAVTRRQSAYLGGRASASRATWTKANLTWPAGDISAGVALGVMMRELKAAIGSKNRVLLEAVVSADKVKVDRERELVALLAERCSQIADPEKLQIFVVYHDPAANGVVDTTARQRAKLGKLWAIEKRGPGCGICTSLDDIGSVDLAGWCTALQEAWKTGGRLLDDVAAKLPTGTRLSMQDAESRIEPILRNYVNGRT